MLRFSHLRRAAPAAAALALLLGACSDESPTGPGPARLDESATPGAPGAAAWNGRIRIGVVPTATSVSIGSEGAWTITDKATGAAVMTGTGGSASVALDAGSVSVSRYRLQVMCSSDAAVAARKALAEARGYPTFTEPVPTAGCTRLYIGSFDPPPASNFGPRNTFRNSLLADGLAGTDSFWRVVTVTTGVTRYKVTRGADVAFSTGPVVLQADAPVTINGAPYRGVAEVIRNSGGTLAGVNELPMEEYLYGVVPRELPPVPYDELEAQKAQAVAARTYAMSGLGKRALDGYDLLPTTSDQVYGGLAAEQALSSRAVDETAGVVATYEGRLIQALFSSTTGGHTASNEEVYNSDPIPYLRGVPDAQRGQALEHVPSLDVFRMHGNPRSLRNAKEGDFEADWSRYHRWSFEWSAEEISAVISAYAQQDVGRVLAINVLERGPSGRVTRIEYVTEAGTFTDTKDRIRSSLKYINASGNQASLLSTLFFIEPVTDRRTGEVEGFEVWGGGWGHGVGLSQTGATGMAEKGATYEEILKHYYQGIDLEKQY